jgi:hypothetical protein
VQHDTDQSPGEITENAMEVRNYKLLNPKIVKLSNGRARLAMSSLYGNVVAMEYVPQASPAMVGGERFDEWVDETAEMLGKVFSKVDLIDTCATNVWYDSNGVLTMIDYVM